MPKKFGGKEFNVYMTCFKKDVAEKESIKLKSEGYAVRIVHGKRLGNYVLWIRKKVR